VVVVAGVMEKISASLLTALGAGLFYLLLIDLGWRRAAWALTITYAFATSCWSVSSQALWQHGAAQLAIIAALLALSRLERRPTPAWFAAAGAAAGAAAAIRLSNLLFLAPLAAAVLLAYRRPRHILSFALAVGLPLGTVLGYNLWVFGRLTGAYSGGFDGSLASGLAGLLFSPARGLLVYTPVLVFALAGLWSIRRRLLVSPIYLSAGLFPLLLVLVTGKWKIWWGGHCYGPRLLADALPCLVLLIAPVWDSISAKRTVRVMFYSLLGASLLVQAVGAFCYPNSGWDEQPTAIGKSPERLWDWRDNPVARSFRAGPRLGPDPRWLPELRRNLFPGPG